VASFSLRRLQAGRITCGGVFFDTGEERSASTAQRWHRVDVCFAVVHFVTVLIVGFIGVVVFAVESIVYFIWWIALWTATCGWRLLVWFSDLCAVDCCTRAARRCAIW
jgi:hypothetical protein